MCSVYIKYLPEVVRVTLETRGSQQLHDFSSSNHDNSRCSGRRT